MTNYADVVNPPNVGNRRSDPTESLNGQSIIAEMSDLIEGHIAHIRAAGYSTVTITDREEVLRRVDRDLPYGLDAPRRRVATPSGPTTRFQDGTGGPSW